MTNSRTVSTAASFLDSIGINTKGSTYNDVYKNSTLIVDSLKYIGVDKVRDSFVEFGKGRPVIDAMAEAGIKFDFRVNYTLPGQGEKGLKDYLAALKAFAADHPGALLSVEGVNEANVNSVAYKGAVGLKAAIDFQRDLYTAVKADPGLSQIKVLNLSLAYDNLADYATVGDLGRYSDAANAHSYTLTGKSADAQMERSLDLARKASSGDPLIVTEVGHTTYVTEPGVGTTETAQAKLLLNNLLLSYENGAQTTYVYELFDNSSSAVRGPKEVHFGIFNEDGTPKQAAKALHNLNAILSNGDNGGNVPASTGYTLSGASADTHSMLLAKSGGVYDIVVWTDVPVFNDITDRDIQNPARPVTIDLGKTESVVRVYDPMAGVEPIAVFQNTATITIPLSDHPLVVEVGTPSTAVKPGASPVSSVSMSATDFVAQMGSLATDAGLKTVKLTDGPTLEVSSVETMAHIIKAYAPVLGKVEGGVTFKVAYGEATWRKVQEFDANGKLTLTTEYGLKDGAVTKTVVTKPNGSVETVRVNETGKATSNTSVAGDGSTKTVTYDPATGKIASEVVKTTGGDVLTTVYANGVKSVLGVTSKDGTKSHTTFDAKSGAILTEFVTKPDGSAVNKTYTAGILTKTNGKNADGTLDNWTYKITGKSYVTEHQVNDATGKILLVERFHADGTFDYREVRAADGSKQNVYYNAAGKIVNDVRTAADGSVTTVNNDPATGKILSEVVNKPNGDTLTTVYANGVKSALGVTSKDGTKSHTTFDAKSGAILTEFVTKPDGSAVNKTYTAGVLTKTNGKNADGTLDNWTYKITGKSYVTEHQVNDAAGKILLVERFHADGTFDYREVRAADGSKQNVYYNAAGKIVNDVRTAADGSVTTVNNDPATGKILSEVVNKPNGDVLTTVYANGVKSALSSVGKDGTKSHTTFDAKSGAILTEFVTKPDGSAVNKTYTAGVLTKTNGKNADGTLDNWTYKITGKSYVTEHQVNDATGKILLVERFHADGTFDYREVRAADGSKQNVYYNAAGKIVNDVRTAADGSVTTVNNDPATGKILSEVVNKPNGDVLTTVYANGVKSALSNVGKDGTKSHTTFDAKSGAILTEFVTKPDGSAVNKTYTAGILTKTNGKNADGTLDNWTYKITGKSYVTEHQVNDATGKILLVERFHADGTFDYREVRAADGSKTTTVYTDAGAVRSKVSIQVDGSKTVETHLQDGSGDIWKEKMDASGTIQARNILHSDGKQDVHAYANGQTLVGTTADDTFYFRTTNNGKMVYDGGNDTVLSFNDGGGTSDRIVLDADWAAKLAHSAPVQQGSDVLIRFDDHNSILIKQMKLPDFHSNYMLVA